MSEIHHRKLPDHWALICGSSPPDEFGFKSDNLQIIYNNTTEAWSDLVPHAHSESDEVYIVQEGIMVVEVNGKIVKVGAGEILCVQAGTVHQLVSVIVPIKSFVIRSPSVNDKFFCNASKA